MVVDALNPDLDPGKIGRSRLGSVLKEIAERPVQFLEVEPAFCRSFMAECDLDVPEFRMQTKRANRVLEGLDKISMNEMQGLLGLRKFQQRRDQLCHLVHRHTNFPIHILSLLLVDVTNTENLRVSQHCRQRMTQVVRDRDRHSPDGRQALGVQQVLLTVLKRLPHFLKSAGHFSEFVAAMHVQRMTEISFPERMDTRHELRERPCEVLGNNEYETTPRDHRKQSHNKQQTVDVPQEES